MKFAVNYSSPLIRLLNEGLIQVDLIKCPDWQGMLQEAQQFGPITIHFDLDVGLGHTFNVDLDRIVRLEEETDTPHINTHLVTPKTLNPNIHAEVKAINSLWHDELHLMVEKFGSKSIALEHYPYTENTPFLLPAVDSASFSKVVQDVDCMLLLDLAHARITAASFKMDVKTYIQSLPLDKLAEVHVTGIRKHGGILTDHFELSEEDWALFEWALGEIQTGNWPEPAIIAFEYGGVGSTFVWRTKFDVLRLQVPKLYELIHRNN
jgi:uncharacterized protein (UPF0276 family)